MIHFCLALRLSLLFIQENLDDGESESPQRKSSKHVEYQYIGVAAAIAPHFRPLITYRQIGQEPSSAASSASIPGPVQKWVLKPQASLLHWTTHMCYLTGKNRSEVKEFAVCAHISREPNRLYVIA
jgi:hypothetical protein